MYIILHKRNPTNQKSREHLCLLLWTWIGQQLSYLLLLFFIPVSNFKAIFLACVVFWPENIQRVWHLITECLTDTRNGIKCSGCTFCSSKRKRQQEERSCWQLVQIWSGGANHWRKSLCSKRAFIGCSWIYFQDIRELILSSTLVRWYTHCWNVCIMTSSSCASASEQVSMSAVRIGSPGARKSNHYKR